MPAARLRSRHGVVAGGVLALIVVVLTLLAPSPDVLAHDIPPGTPPDVAEAMKRLQSGEYSMADVMLVQRWSQQLQGQMNLPQPGPAGPTRPGTNQPQGIPCKVEATIAYTATAPNESIRVQMSVSADAVLFASINGNADYNQNLLKPGAAVSSFRFAPSSPGALVGGGSMTRVETHGKDTRTDKLTFTQAAASMLLVTSGSDALYPQGGSGIGGSGDGTTASGTSSSPLHASSETNEVLSVPFVMEANQSVTVGSATPRPAMQLSYKGMVAAVQATTQTVVSAGESFDFTNKGGSHVVGQSTLKITLHPAPSELRLKPVDESAYTKWLPVPHDVDGEDAKMYDVKPRDPEGGLAFWVGFEDKSKSCPLELELRDVNDAKGLSTNYPPTGAQPRKGLHFLPSSDIQFAKGDQEQQQRAETKGSATSVTVRVVAEDTGAWGRLVAFCKDSPERLATTMISGKARPFLSIPFDEDDDHIADAWWDAPGNAPRVGPTVDEDDDPAGQPENGDGYTAYEEYRGFVVLTDSGATTRKFVRTSPHRKDLFVYDKNHLVKTHYEPHNREAANLELHYVSPALMQYKEEREASYPQTGPENLRYPPHPSAEHRWVNVNTPDPLRYRRQYAVVELIDHTLYEPATGKCVEGETKRPIDVDWNTTYGRPLLNFAAARVNDTCSDTKIAENAKAWLGDEATPELIEEWKGLGLTNTVIHEFGHAIGITHHQEEKTVAGVPVVYDRDHDATFYGPVDCAMRYANNPRDTTRAQNHIKPFYMRYCRRHEPGEWGTTNANGERKLIKLPDGGLPPETATCFEQIRLKGSSVPGGP